jgi:hypothetical protein
MSRGSCHEPMTNSVGYPRGDRLKEVAERRNEPTPLGGVVSRDLTRSPPEEFSGAGRSKDSGRFSVQGQGLWGPGTGTPGAPCDFRVGC